MDLDLIVRRMGWERNKRTLGAPARVDEISLKKARDLHAAGKYEEALAFLSGIKSCGEDSRCLRVAGLCHLGLNHAQEAIQIFSLSRELSRIELAWDEMNLCVALLTAKHFEEAIDAARRAVDLAPNEVGAHINMIAALQRAKDHAGLERYLIELRENFPDMIEDPLFKDRLERDPDFIGVKQRLEPSSTQKGGL
jgi:tetratricopeptide (TPR) repeat protein